MHPAIRVAPVVLLTGCGSQAKPAPTWHGDVAPLVAAHCWPCHAAEGVGPSFVEPESAQRWAPAMAAAVSARTMPPWLAAPMQDCAPPWTFEEDPRLDAATIATFVAWAQAGGPLGDPAEATTLPVVVGADVLDANVSFGADLEIPSDGEDAVVCRDLGVLRSSPSWMLAAQVVARAPAVTHHAVVTLSAAPGPSDWTPCPGFVADADPILFWAPGTGPLRVPEGAGVPLAADQHLILQVHLHPLGVPGPYAAPEVQLVLTEESPARSASLWMVGDARDASEGLLPGPGDGAAPTFRIPAGSVAHTETMEITLPDRDDVLLWGIGHHMHRFGDAMATWWTHEGQTSCLLATPEWQMDWHRLYLPEPAAPIRLTAGDTLRLRCSYRNDLDHPGAARAYAEAGVDGPVDVGLGTGPIDEMCLALLGLVEP
ncbi:MAG: hypothetical protein RLZZ383_1693 [Pseudomonadota bacterium]|jgi:hypothetical protein